MLDENKDLFKLYLKPSTVIILLTLKIVWGPTLSTHDIYW